MSEFRKLVENILREGDKKSSIKTVLTIIQVRMKRVFLNY